MGNPADGNGWLKRCALLVPVIVAIAAGVAYAVSASFTAQSNRDMIVVEMRPCQQRLLERVTRLEERYAAIMTGIEEIKNRLK